MKYIKCLLILVLFTLIGCKEKKKTALEKLSAKWVLHERYTPDGNLSILDACEPETYLNIQSSGEVYWWYAQYNPTVGCDYTFQKMIFLEYDIPNEITITYQAINISEISAFELVNANEIHMTYDQFKDIYVR